MAMWSIVQKPTVDHEIDQGMVHEGIGEDLNQKIIASS